jgi:predicted outer membrane repeat protein
MPGRNGLVQDTLFRRNSAAVEGGAVFVYGAALFLTNEFVSNAAVGLYKSNPVDL